MTNKTLEIFKQNKMLIFRKAKPAVLGFEQPCDLLNTMKNGIRCRSGLGKKV